MPWGGQPPCTETGIFGDLRPRSGQQGGVHMRKRMAAFILLGGLGFLTGLLAACGGGSSSNTGPSAGGGGGFSGGSGAVIQGQLVRGGSAALGESRVMVVLRGALGIGLAEAAAGEP